MLIGDIVCNYARSFPNKTALITEEASFSWAEFNARINSLANAMLGLGLKKGDRAAILAQNGKEAAEFQLAAGKCGVIGTALNYRLLPEQIFRQVDDCQPKLFFVQAQLANKVEAITNTISPNTVLVSIGDTGAHHLNYESLIEDYPATEPEVELREDAPCMIVYTSGTTGWVKGVIYTHRTRFIHAVQGNLLTRAGSNDVFIIDGPLFAAGAQFRFYDALLSGSTMIVYTFSPERWAQFVERERVTIASIPLIRYDLIREYLDHCDREYDLSSLTRIAMAGGAFQSGERVRDICRFFNVKFCSKCYGSTEAGVPIAFLPEEMAVGLEPNASEGDIKKLDAMGRPLLCEVRIVDDNGQDVSAGQVGEIWFRGDCIFPGYWNKPGLYASAGGWYHTLDLAYHDEDGLIYFAGRKDLMIKTGGFNVYPEEVEAVIAKHPAVAETAVFGVEHPEWGEQVTAAVVLKNGESASEEDINQHCRRYLSGFQVPKRVHFLDKLPATETMLKVARMELRRMFSQADP